jgi:hypothetical protein
MIEPFGLHPVVSNNQVRTHLPGQCTAKPVVLGPVAVVTGRAPEGAPLAADSDGGRP